jgi:hypothetical protein
MIMDRIGFTRVYFIILVIQLIASILIQFSRENGPFFVICVGLSLLAEGGQFSTFNAASPRIFGPTYGGVICSVVFTAITFSSFTEALVTKLSRSESFKEIMLSVGTGLTLMNMLILVFFDDSEMQLDKDGNPIPTKNTIFAKVFGGRRSSTNSNNTEDKTYLQEL